MEFSNFLHDMLGITADFGIIKIEKIKKPEKIIRIHLEYLPNNCIVENTTYKLYDYSPVRAWQHLSWFEYKCYLVCKLPRYINSSGKVTTYNPKFAPTGRSYTNLFSKAVVNGLQLVRVQNTVAQLFKTTPYIVRSIMEDNVNKAIEKRGLVNDFTNISIDEKAYARGHEYATVLIDSDKEYVVDLHEGRKEKSLKALFYLISGQVEQPQLKRVNIDMWKPYMNCMQSIAPQALIVHDKFHLIKKLSEAINLTRKIESKHNELLRKQKFTVLKNSENRTEKQQEAFKEIEKANLKTASAWHIRENFKSIWFTACNKIQALNFFNIWSKASKEKEIEAINKVVETFENHKDGIVNAIVTDSDSGMHENTNGRIQAVISKARGFINFERFRINVLFYFGNLKFH